MTQMTLPEAFEMAMRQKAAGNLAAAESIYRQLLAAAPNHPDLLHMMGVLAMQTGKLPLALELIDRSIQVNPQQAGYYTNRAQVLSQMGRTDEAIAMYQRALSMQPGLLEASNNLAHIYRQRGQLAEAAACYRAALQAQPDSPVLWSLLAIALSDLRDFSAAAEAWRRIIQLEPENPDAANNLGNALQEMGRYDEAIESYQAAMELRNIYPEAHNNIGNAYLRSGRPQEAVEQFERAVQQKPDYAEAHRGLGNALKACDRYDEAIAAHAESIRLQPGNVEALSDQGATLHAAAKFAEAEASFRRAIAISPPFADAHFNLGLSLLLRGHLEEGWIEHEWRSQVASHIASQIRFPIPQWNGEPIDGKRLLLYAEQGFGDTLMAVRYLPMAAQRAGKVSFICPKELSRLLAGVPGIDDLIVPADEFPRVDADVQCSLMTLPRIFRTTLETIPAKIPYLKADPDLVDRYRTRFAAAEDRLKIGVVWSGRITPDPKRSIPLTELAPLAHVTNAKFFSLQHGGPANDPRPAGLESIDVTQGIEDFADMAALMAHLDLVITIDTAAAHLAGAMGKRTFVLLPWVPDWRWLLDRSDSPWYPTMKLFRQLKLNDWHSPIQRMVAALNEQPA